MQVEEQALTLCFATPIWRFEFSDFEAVNAEILEQLDRLGWEKLDEKYEALMGEDGRGYVESEVRVVSAEAEG